MTSFLWTTLHVADLDRSLTFYKEAVGLTLSRQFVTPDGTKIAFLGQGDTQVELIERAGESFTFSGGISLGFSVNNLEDKIKALDEAGIALHEGPIAPNPQIRFFYVLDPDGIKVQFVEGSLG